MNAGSAALPAHGRRVSAPLKVVVSLPGRCLMKARGFADVEGAVEPLLTPDEVVDVFAHDLAARHVDHGHRPADPTTDNTWLDLVHDVCYPTIPSD